MNAYLTYPRANYILHISPGDQEGGLGINNDGK